MAENPYRPEPHLSVILPNLNHPSPEVAWDEGYAAALRDVEAQADQDGFENAGPPLSAYEAVRAVREGNNDE